MGYKQRRFIGTCVGLTLLVGGFWLSSSGQQSTAPTSSPPVSVQPIMGSAAEKLKALPVKGRAPKTGYSREQFGGGWHEMGNCDIRNQVLRRDLIEVKVASEADCTVLKGTLQDPYTGKVIQFQRGQTTSDDVQIDHIVALSDAWQKGAQQLSPQQRAAFANDPLNLLAVDGPTNMQKSDGDAATWLPPNKSFRCAYVARQIAVKTTYNLWITQAEYDAMQNILRTCPDQPLPVLLP